MNHSRLNELAAIKGMGWRLNQHYGDKEHYPYQMYERPGLDAIPKHEWNPSTSADDALVLIAKISKRWQLDTWPGTLVQTYSCGIYNEDGEEQYGARGDSAALVLCLTALRAAGIPESEIAAAMKED